MSNALVIMQKGESQNGCFKKAMHAKIYEKQTFFTPLIRTRPTNDYGVELSVVLIRFCSIFHLILCLVLELERIYS